MLGGGSTKYACEDCPVGKFQHLTRQTTCTLCQPGFYQNNTAQRECLACPLGMYQSFEAQTMCTPWLTCSKGEGVRITEPGTSTTTPTCDGCRALYGDGGIATFQPVDNQLSHCVGYMNSCGDGVVHQQGDASTQRLCRFVNADACPSGFAEHSQLDNGVVCRRSEYLCPT